MLDVRFAEEPHRKGKATQTGAARPHPSVVAAPSDGPRWPLVAQGWLRARRAMVVEDDPILLLDLVRVIEGAGHRVVATAARGEAAIAAYDRMAQAGTAPDLVLLDIDLGRGMDGIEAARRIRAADATVAIAFRTAYGDAATRAWAEGVGAVAFIDKSLPVETVLRVLATIPTREAREGG